MAATLVLVPNVPLGLLTNAVQTLAGVLLPSASVFLLLLCNDKELLGPWANSFKLNVFTSLVVGVLVLLSLILTAAVLFPDIGGGAIIGILGGGAAFGGIAVAAMVLKGGRPGRPSKTSAAVQARLTAPTASPDAAHWRAPRLETFAQWS